MVDPRTGWLEIVKVLTYDLDDATGSNDEYIDKSSVRFSHLFNNTWIRIYLYPRKVFFDKKSEF